MKVNVKAFVVSVGLTSGLSIFLLTIIRDVLDRGMIIRHLKAILPGYSVSVLGAFIGFFWVFLYSAILAFIFAKLYNSLTEK